MENTSVTILLRVKIVQKVVQLAINNMMIHGSDIKDLYVILVILQVQMFTMSMHNFVINVVQKIHIM